MKSKIINTYVKAISASQKITRMDICSCFLDVNLTQKFELGLNKKNCIKALDYPTRMVVP